MKNSLTKHFLNLLKENSLNKFGKEEPAYIEIGLLNVIDYLINRDYNNANHLLVFINQEEKKLESFKKSVN